VRDFLSFFFFFFFLVLNYFFVIYGWEGMAFIGNGFSRNFISAVAWQVLGGAMSSNVGIVRCVVAELNPEKR
jgi:hypothetical protein